MMKNKGLREEEKKAAIKEFVLKKRLLIEVMASVMSACMDHCYEAANPIADIDRKNHYEGFTTTEGISVDKVVGFLDAFSFRVRKDTFVILNNATVHRNHKIQELRPVWEKRDFFYLSPYSPHLNIAETLWRILKGKMNQTIGLCDNRLSFLLHQQGVGRSWKWLSINYSHIAA
jgi:transposase